MTSIHRKHGELQGNFEARFEGERRPEKKPSARRVDIDQAKGLAILFVVFGHLVARADPHNVHWYEPLRRAVYAFHMPFFLYLSGIVAVLSGALFSPPEKWRRLIATRADRLLIPFFVLGILIVVGKTFARHFVFVDNQPASLWVGLTNLFWHTVDSPALSIWYLYVVFVLSVVSPVLVWANAGRLYYLLAVTFIIYWIPLPPYLYLDHIGQYSIFFVLGALAANRDEKWLAFVDRYWPILLVLLVCILAAIAKFGVHWPEKIDLLPVGALSMPALHGLVRHISGPIAALFLWLGRNTMVIYLFNTIFIGLGKGLALHVTKWDGSHFIYFATFLMLFGTLGPIAFRELVLRRVPILARYTQ